MKTFGRRTTVVLAILLGALLLGVIVIVGIARGFGTPSVATDPKFARELLDAVYAGSLSSVQNSLHPPFQRLMGDTLTAGTAAVLRENFGTVTNLELQSSTKIPPRGLVRIGVQTVWRVTAERGTFEMKVNFDRQGKAAFLWFRASSAYPWSTASELGVAYIKQHRTRGAPTR